MNARNVRPTQSLIVQGEVESIHGSNHCGEGRAHAITALRTRGRALFIAMCSAASQRPQRLAGG